MNIRNNEKRGTPGARYVKVFGCVLCALFIIAGCIGCGKGSVRSIGEAKAYSKAYSTADTVKQSAKPAGGVMYDAAPASIETAADYAMEESVYDGERISDNGSAETVIPQNADAAAAERKLVYTGSIEIQVQSLAETEQSVRDWVKAWGGYITYSTAWERNLEVTARIPSAKFQAALDEVSGIGAVKHRSVSTEDVTEQFYDTYARLETRKILRDRLQNYLKTSQTMKDLIAVEKELNNVQSDIESMESRFRRLSNRIDYATISVYASLPANTTERGFVYPDMGYKARELWANTVNFFASFVFGIFYVVLYGIPLVAAAAFVYWLCFGRIGLLRKLFTKLGKKK